MLRAAVTAVRGVPFKPMHPLSGVYAGVITFSRPKVSCRKREREGGCEGVTVWMCRCDFDVEMCVCVRATGIHSDCADFVL